ncbi:MAG: amidohydrolase family protein [Sporolactobacillus sp.]
MKTDRLRCVQIVGTRDHVVDVTLKDGKVAAVIPSSDDETRMPLKKRWLAPGFVDLHTHLTWTDFDHTDQEKRSVQEQEAMQAAAFTATFRAGMTIARDAGGLEPSIAARLSEHYCLPLSAIACGAMLDADDARGAGYLQKRIQGISKSGATWIKLFATGGLGSPTEKVLDPLFSKEEMAAVISSAHAHHMRVMVHTWGGSSLDWAIEAGVDTVEHGVFMTEDQAARLAEAQIPLIPTTAIYRIAADSHGPLALPELICTRAARAAEAHLTSVRAAKRAGVRIGFGTDFATPMLHGHNLIELDALVDCGLTRAEAWQAATVNGRRILRLPEWTIQRGAAVNAVVYHADPLSAGDAAALHRMIAGVFKGDKQWTTKGGQEG